jgi:hypothetical protein
VTAAKTQLGLPQGNSSFLVLASLVPLCLIIIFVLAYKYYKSSRQNRRDSAESNKMAQLDSKTMVSSSEIPGLDPKVKKRLMSDFDRHFRKLRYKADTENLKQSDCKICGVEFQWYESIRQLRPCKDLFHEACILTHLETTRSCPICNVDLNWQTLDQNKSYFSNEDHSSQADNSVNLGANLNFTGLQFTPRTFEQEMQQMTPRTMANNDISLDTVKQNVRKEKQSAEKFKKRINAEVEQWSKGITKSDTGGSTEHPESPTKDPKGQTFHHQVFETCEKLDSSLRVDINKDFNADLAQPPLNPYSPWEPSATDTPVKGSSWKNKIFGSIK